MAYQPSASRSPAARVSDADRNSAVDALTSHVATGRLSIDDFDLRAAQAYAAVTQADLAGVLADLPAEVVDKNEPARSNHEVLVWAGVGALCLAIWAITSIATGSLLYFWPVWVIGPWGAMLTLQRVTGARMPMGCTSRRAFD